ncbi:MAG: hypothetical protein UHD09_09215 [Bifidobacterium sp.]|nr:hypothetical protein [Bifidobacterium sp.]
MDAGTRDTDPGRGSGERAAAGRSDGAKGQSAASVPSLAPPRWTVSDRPVELEGLEDADGRRPRVAHGFQVRSLVVGEDDSDAPVWAGGEPGFTSLVPERLCRVLDMLDDLDPTLEPGLLDLVRGQRLRVRHLAHLAGADRVELAGATLVEAVASMRAEGDLPCDAMLVVRTSDGLGEDEWDDLTATVRAALPAGTRLYRHQGLLDLSGRDPWDTDAYGRLAPYRPYWWVEHPGPKPLRIPRAPGHGELEVALVLLMEPSDLDWCLWTPMDTTQDDEPWMEAGELAGVELDEALELLATHGYLPPGWTVSLLPPRDSGDAWTLRVQAPPPERWTRPLSGEWDRWLTKRARHDKPAMPPGLAGPGRVPSVQARQVAGILERLCDVFRLNHPDRQPPRIVTAAT